jgi:1-acyl-sn-glycerol-3-phosphate acyltransferase
MTVHDTPVIKTLMRFIALMIFRIAGWKAEGQRPDIPRYVIIAAPHTSNWDFLYTLCLVFIFKVKPRIMMKDDWFRWPLGPVFKWLGLRPIRRAGSHNVVAQSIKALQDRSELAVIVPPSGTRGKVNYWKTGFYFIALGARVPIVLGYLDYERKVGGIGPTVTPTGDIDADMIEIRKFYANITGKHPKKSINYQPRPEPIPIADK